MQQISPNIVEVFPDPLIISQNSKSNYLESQLNLSNLTNEFVIFKIYNNQRELYSAKPSTSFIGPKEKTIVTIKRFKKGEQPTRAGKDKFLLIFYTINKVITDKEEAKEAFKLKLYNESSKQESMISIILDENENNLEQTYTYDESVLQDIGDDYIKGIKAYTDLNEKLRKQSNTINHKIKEMENALGMIKTQKQLKNDKDKAISSNNNKNKSGDNNLAQIFLVCLMLLGLLIGANIAKGYNKLLYGKKNIKNVDEILINKNDNIIIENNKSNNSEIITNLNNEKENEKLNETIIKNETEKINEENKNKTKNEKEKENKQNEKQNKENINKNSNSKYLRKSLYICFILYLNL